MNGVYHLTQGNRGKKMAAEFDCYAAWGFVANPFQPSPLHPDPRGERLMVGRDEELGHVKARLHRHGKITCVEGPVGIGKTSLVNIAAYQCLTAYLEGAAARQLLIPCKKVFQLDPKQNAEDFTARVLMDVAETLIDQAEKVKGNEFSARIRGQVAPLLDQEKVDGTRARLRSALESEVSASAALSNSGLQRVVEQWLEEIFPTHGSGGVVCIIDNLELLETATKARKILEALRDRLFNIEGLRWVFCGANGIVSSVIASPRLSGYLIRPVLELKSIHGSKVPELLERRTIEFASSGGQEYLPIVADDMQQLYKIINFNLRDLLAHADDYCMHVFETGSIPKTEDQKKKRFQDWLDRQTVEQYRELYRRITRDAWEILDTAMSEDLKGTFGPGDFNYFKKNSFQTIEYKTFLNHLRKFEDLGVISRWVDEMQEDDKKRTIFSVTSKGALVHYGRVLKDEARTMATLWIKRVTLK